MSIMDARLKTLLALDQTPSLTSSAPSQAQSTSNIPFAGPNEERMHEDRDGEKVEPAPGWRLLSDTAPGTTGEWKPCPIGVYHGSE
jgi:hypothetical protein